MSINVSRRLFFPVAVGFALTASGSTQRRASSSVRSIFTEIQSDITDAGSAVRHFMQTDFLGLLSVYNDFYPILRDGDGFQAIPALKATIAKVGPSYTSNTRRLDAMPAIMAIHLLSKTSNRGPLEHEILSTLHNHPHARELLLQNLITATLPASDSIINGPVTRNLITAVHSALAASISQREFFQDACPALQYLLNIRSLLKSYDHGNAIIHDIDKIIVSLQSSKLSSTRELKTVIREHNHIFSRPIYSDPLSLSPQITEVIYGITSVPSSWTRYAENMVIVNARMFYNHFSAWKGETAYHGLTSVQAEEYVAKSIRFWRERGLYKILQRAGVSDDYAGQSEPSFQKFLHSELKYLLNNAEKEGLDVVRLAGSDGYSSPISANTFPLVRYRLDARFASEVKKMNDDDRNWLGTSLNVGRDLSIGLATTAVAAIIKWRWQQIKRRTNKIDQKVLEEKIENYSTRTSDGLGKQQKDIGPVRVDISV